MASFPERLHDARPRYHNPERSSVMHTSAEEGLLFCGDLGSVSQNEVGI